jgi:hypothetical protein
MADYVKTPWRFWARVSRTDDCWEWQAYVKNNGYGVLRHCGRLWHAHRLAWLITHGELADEAFVCHRCDNPRCVRPDHLFLGTHTDNMRDAWSKGRGRNPMTDANAAKTHCSRGHEFTAENTNVLPDSSRQCRTCRRENCRAWRARLKANAA